MPTLLVLRHAETESIRPAFTDHDRRLTARGVQQAASVGDWLRTNGFQPDRVFCSSALRAQQTLLGLGLDLPAEHLEIADEFYNCGSDTVLDRLRELDGDAACALVVAHSPGLPSVVYELADPATSDPAALQAVDSHYPAGTLSVLHTDQPWPALQRARLVAVQLP